MYYWHSIPGAVISFINLCLELINSQALTVMPYTQGDPEDPNTQTKTIRFNICQFRDTYITDYSQTASLENFRVFSLEFRVTDGADLNGNNTALVLF
jgi:hypothetical protein